MKNKRNVLIAFILICCMCLSIGYAALTDTLYVDGKANVSVLGSEEDLSTPDTPFEQKFADEIYWSAANGETNVTCSRVAEGNGIGVADKTDSTVKPDVLLITIPAGVLTAEGDSTTITATVTNGSDYNINAVLSVVTENNQYLDISWDWATGYDATIDEGATADVVITVTLTTAPTADIDNAAFSMTLTATATN